MKKLWFLLTCLLLLGCPVDSVNVDDGGITDAGQDIKFDTKPKDASIDIKNPEAGLNFDMWPPTTGSIFYHGGPVMTIAVPVYIIWYGNWNNNSTVPIVEDLVTGLSESPYFTITSDYYQIVSISTLSKSSIIDQVPSTNKLIFTKSIFVNPTLGTHLSDDGVFNVVSNAITDNLVPSDPIAIYLVLTSGEIGQGGPFGGFCSGYCGWHDHKVFKGINIKYSFVGDPAKCLDSCTAKSKYDEYGINHSPNNNWSADGMASVIAHELTETITDPDWNTAPGWLDGQGYENADKCAWNYGAVYLTSTGSVANVKLGSREYLLQQNWVLDEDAGQHCGLHP